MAFQLILYQFGSNRLRFGIACAQDAQPDDPGNEKQEQQNEDWMSSGHNMYIRRERFDGGPVLH